MPRPSFYVQSDIAGDVESAGGRSSSGAESPSPNDPFHDPAIRLVSVAFFLAVIGMIVALSFVYWAVEYQRPSWNVHSVPAPDAP